MKKTWIIVIFVVIMGFAWYLFLNPSDYSVRFKAKTSPGTVFEAVMDWGNTNENVTNLNKTVFSDIVQEVKINDSILIIRWKFDGLNDSITQVKMNVTDKNNSLENKLAIPFTNSAIEKISKNLVLNLKASLDNQLKSYKVKIEGEYEIPETFCACTTISTPQQKKAYGMMQNNYLITDFLYHNNFKITGKPFVEVTDWDLENSMIKFNFCFPTVQKDSLPSNPKIFFKTILKQKGIKAIFNGNYKSSDKAWYGLYDHAKRNGLRINPEPFEIYLDNPNNGGDELKWTAEVFMPLAKD